jgi:hypothetical protein
MVDLTRLSIEDREFSKFDTNLDGEVIVRTSATGTFSPTGLSTAGIITTMNVSGIAIKLPNTPLANRNAISIYNKSTTDILYIGFNSNLTPDDTLGTTAGWEIDPQGYVQFDVTDDIEIYGITTGATILIKIMEVA